MRKSFIDTSLVLGLATAFASLVIPKLFSPAYAIEKTSAVLGEFDNIQVPRYQHDPAKTEIVP